MKLFGQQNRHLSILLLILVLAATLRLWGLGRYPVGFTPDEASFGYDAYSLLKTGKDQWGETWPVSFRSFGDYKLPLYTYLTIPSVAAFGLNEFATRLPNAVVGISAVIAAYLMARELFKDSKLGIFASFLLAISPWHVSLSRGAFEANLTVLFMSLGVWAFYKGLKESKWLAWSAIFFGINLFTYHSARLVTPLIVFGLFFLNRKLVSRRSFVPLGIFLGFLILAFSTILTGSGARAIDITIFNPTDKWMAVFDRRYDAVFEGEPYLPARFFSNKFFYVISKFVVAYSTYLSPQFLFTLGPSEWTYGMIAGRGVLYLIELPFVLTAAWWVSRYGLKNSKAFAFVLFWILIAILPAALTKGPGYAANRAAVMMPAIQIISAFGAIILYQKMATFLKSNRQKKLLLYGGFALLLSSLVFYLEDYRFHAPRQGAEGMLYGRVEVVKSLAGFEKDYKKIIISRSLSEPQIFVAFYTRFDPTAYQKEAQDWLRYKDLGLPFVDQLGEYSLGKYTFKNINYLDDSKIPNVLLVGKPQEFPEKVKPIETITYPNQLPAILIVDPLK